MRLNQENLTMKTRFLLAFVLFSSLLLGGCASKDVVDSSAEGAVIEPGAELVEDERDPYESFNRKVYSFNNQVDTYVAKPVSDAYLWVTPTLVQTGIANFFSNLKEINVVINDTLQGKFKQGAEDTGRFAVNSTIGLLGIFDVATELGLEKNEEDFAQTLAVWGVPQGSYLVLPFIGPTTSRGIPGSVFDTAANPTTYVGFPVQLVSMLNTRANAEGALNFIDEAALDPYVFTRESFLQHRKFLITDGESEATDDALDLESEFYEDDELLETESENVIETTTQKTEPESKKNSDDVEELNAVSDYEQSKAELEKATLEYRAVSKELEAVQQ